MKTTILTAASILAIMAAMPAHAEDPKINNSYTNKPVSEDAKDAWKNVKEDTSQAADDVSDSAKKTYDTVKAAVLGDENQKSDTYTYVDVNHEKTATNIIGQPVINASKERVGTVEDIIVDSRGKAQLIIVGDGELITIGDKLAAFDYPMVIKMDAKGDVVMPLTEDTIKKAASFSYDKSKADAKTHAIGSGQYSVAKILDAKIVNSSSENVADVDDVTFTNGQAQELVIGFDKILGMGGKKAVVAYNNVKLVPTDDKGDLNFQLTASQAAQFESYKKTATN